MYSHASATPTEVEMGYVTLLQTSAKAHDHHDNQHPKCRPWGIRTRRWHLACIPRWINTALSGTSVDRRFNMLSERTSTTTRRSKLMSH